jgi:hypothetical protein
MSCSRKSSVISNVAIAALVFAAVLVPAPTYATDGPTDSASVDETISSKAPLSPELSQGEDSEIVDQARLDEVGGDPRLSGYWTSERMSGAIPIETPRQPDDNTSALPRTPELSPLTTSEPVAEPAEATVAGMYALPKTTPVTNFSKTNGKVFFRNAADGQDYVCSGSALNSGSKRLVSCQLVRLSSKPQ